MFWNRIIVHLAHYFLILHTKNFVESDFSLINQSVVAFTNYFPNLIFTLKILYKNFVKSTFSLIYHNLNWFHENFVHEPTLWMDAAWPMSICFHISYILTFFCDWIFTDKILKKYVTILALNRTTDLRKWKQIIN